MTLFKLYSTSKLNSPLSELKFSKYLFNKDLK
jgi:hypothetical protein